MKDRETIFILCLVAIVMGLLMGSEMGSNAELSKSNQTQQDSIEILNNELSALNDLYMTHAQINLIYANRDCNRCDRKIKNDSVFMELASKLH